MMVKMMVSYWMNDNGALAGDGDDGNQLSKSVQVTAGSCLTCRYRGLSKRRSMNVSPILQHFSHDGGGFPLAAKHQFKPGPLGA